MIICSLPTTILAGIRQEQDIFVRLIDSATKTVSSSANKKCQHFWWSEKKSFDVAFWRLILLSAMRSESVRWKEGRRCQFSGLCPRAQCRTSHSLSHEPNYSPVTCQLANINMGQSGALEIFKAPNLLLHKTSPTPWPPYHSSIGACKLQTSKWASTVWTEKEVLKVLLSQCFTAAAQHLRQPSPYKTPLSCHLEAAQRAQL